MKALIFAAGLGTRLKPLTDTMPKALVKVGGRPLLQIVCEKLVAAGTNEIVVNAHHFSEQIKEWIAAHDFSVPVKVSDETNRLLDTGGGLRKALPLFSDKNEPILIHNVDILSNLDLSEFYKTYAGQAAALLLVSQRATSRYLLFDHSNRLVGWTNVDTGEVRSPFRNLDVGCCKKYAFSGIHIFGHELRPLLNNFPEKFSIIDFYLSVCDKVPVCAHFSPNLQLLDVGKINSLTAAEDFLKDVQKVK